MGKNSRRAAVGATVAVLPEGAPIPVVGGREACPCGSGKRYKACHGRQLRQESTRLVTRPFEGLSGEGDWIALREIVPAATAAVRTTAEYGSMDVTVASVLPMAWPGLRRADGSLLLGLQTAGGSGDPSRDLADALLRGLAAQPGSPVMEAELPGPGPRLQDVLEPDRPFEVTVHDGFDFWLLEAQEITADVRDSMERANAAVVPTRRLHGVDCAYWCRVADRCHLRWVVRHEESALLDGVARLHAVGGSALIEGSRYVGSFRAHGLVVPVWDLPLQTEPEELEQPVKEFATRLEEAMASTAPLTTDERRARAGVVSRQVTLR
jgi:hypothetical protein